MNKLLIPSLIVLFSLLVLLEKNKDLETQAFELFVKNVEMKLESNVIRDKTLKPILDDLGDYMGDHLFSMLSDNDDDYKGRIKNFTANCEELPESQFEARCRLLIQYKSLDLTGITFYTGLDKDKKPETILDVDISGTN